MWMLDAASRAAAAAAAAAACMHAWSVAHSDDTRSL